jgi:DnaJ family protein A protein 2
MCLQFKKINVAHDVLIDEEKRKVYDQHGKEGIQAGMEGGGGGASDMFDMLFGGGGGRRRGGGGGPRKGEDHVQPVQVSLEDLYKGKMSKMAVHRDRICRACSGKGGKEGSEKPCDACRGRGMQVHIRRLGPGMVQQVQSPCHDCHGKGRVISDKDRCRTCRGAKVTKERKVLEVYIEPGMKNGQKVSFPGESDESPGMMPGDIHFVIREKDHDVFKRRGADLFMEKHITLCEALVGTEFLVTHLDGRKLIIKTKAGEILKPQTVRGIAGEGMPIHKSPFSKGRLFVVFHVDFPPSGSLTEAQKKGICALLPRSDPLDIPRRDPDSDMDADGESFPEEHVLDEIDPRSKVDAGAHSEAYESDDEGGPGVRTVPCHAQ